MNSLATLTAITELNLKFNATARLPLYYGHASDTGISRKIEMMTEKRAEYDSQVSALSAAANNICRWFCPIVNPDNPELMSIFADPGHIKTGRRTTGKPGKLLSKLLPGATDKEKESFAVWWKETVILPREGLTVKETTDGKKIGEVYTGTMARSSDPSLSARGWKSLSASCMRYNFDELPQHPATVYGSGDFRLYWVENSEGHIAARVIVAIRNGRFVPGPIYCNSNAAGGILEGHIKQESEKPRDGESVALDSWINCRLSRIEHNGGFIAPYLDEYQSAMDTGSFIKLCNGSKAEVELSSTQGVVYIGCAHLCFSCDTRLCEDDMFSSSDGESYCGCCYSERYTYCDTCHEETEQNDMERVLNCRGHIIASCCSHCLGAGNFENGAYEIGGYWYESDSVVFDVDCNPHVIDSDTYFVSDLTGDIHSIEDQHTLPNGDTCTMEEAVDTGNWDWVTDKVFFSTYTDYSGNQIERFKVTHRLQLKPWLELDHGGDVVNNQIDLLDIGLPGVECEGVAA